MAHEDDDDRPATERRLFVALLVAVVVAAVSVPAVISASLDLEAPARAHSLLATPTPALTPRPRTTPKAATEQPAPLPETRWRSFQWRRPLLCCRLRLRPPSVRIRKSACQMPTTNRAARGVAMAGSGNRSDKTVRWLGIGP